MSWRPVCAVLVGAALLAVGCGKNESATPAGSATATTARSSPAPTGPGTVKPSGSLSFVDVASGKVIGDPTGLPVYALETDVAGTGACVDACAEKWPPLAPSTSPLAPGLDAAKVATITRADGSPQMTYGGRPLYTFIGDSPGVATCQGGDGRWWLLNADGTLNKKPA